MSDPAAARLRSGFVYGLVAYLWWGVVPLYFAALMRYGMGASEILSERVRGAAEILAHRITWSLPIMLMIVSATGGWADLFRVLRDRRLVLILLASSALLAINWLLYIFATVTGRVAEASLGYYMMPLVNAALATIFLGEKLRAAHYPALALIAIGVAVPAVAGGYFPWLAVSVTISFGLYGLVRKQVPVESTTGLTIETILLLPISGGFLVYLWATGQNHMAGDWGLNALILFSGIVTVVPLLTFTLALRRLPLLALSFMQFISPTVQMLLAVWFLGEVLTADRIAAFACVWAAVAIFIGDAIWQVRQKRLAQTPPQPLPQGERGFELPLPSQGRGLGG